MPLLVQLAICRGCSLFAVETDVPSFDFIDKFLVVTFHSLYSELPIYTDFHFHFNYKNSIFSAAEVFSLSQAALFSQNFCVL